MTSDFVVADETSPAIIHPEPTDFAEFGLPPVHVPRFEFRRRWTRRRREPGWMRLVMLLLAAIGALVPIRR